MKREKLTSCIWAVCLSLTAAVGGIGCMVSGFSLEPVGVGTLLLSWTLAAVVFALCFTYKRGLYPLCGLGLLGGFLWQKGPLNQSFEQLLWELSQIYNGAYGWGVIRWSETSLRDVHTTTALCWLGLLVVICVVRTIVSRSSVWLGVGASALPLIACLVVTDTVPDEIWLYLLLLAVVLMLLTHTVRRREAGQGNRLSLLTVIPVALSLALLFLCIPRDGYAGQAGAVKLEELVVNLFSDAEMPKVPQVNTGLSTSGGRLAENVNLKTVGPKAESQIRVMSVTATQSRTLYLRGFSYDRYTGTAWESTVDKEIDAWPESGALRDIGQVSISTISTHDVLYMPYYPADADWSAHIREGAVENTDRLQDYTVAWAALTSPVQDAPWGSVFFYTDNMDPYLQLPEETKFWAAQWAAQILREELPLDAGAITREKVEAIADYVRNSAAYDLSTDRMSNDAKDFARWFLEESDTGYCVHFATATAVLLRAAGIPARYVTGYMVQAEANREIQVRGKNAHAWVEYCLPGGVWQVLESTPAAADDPAVETTAGTEPPQQATVSTTVPDDIPPVTTLPVSSQSTTSPGSTEDTSDASRRPETPTPSGWFGKLLGSLLLAVIGTVVVVGQWRLRVYLRWKQQHSGPGNKRALARWQDVVRMSKLLGKQPEEALHTLALKAKFSQYTLKPEELIQFDQSLSALRKELKKRPAVAQLYYTLILAIY